MRRQENPVEEALRAVYIKLLSIAFCALLISACDSGGTSVVPDVVVDDSRPVGSPVTGVLDSDTDAVTVRFTIEEDGVLDALFQLPDANTQQTGGRATINTLPTEGELTLRSDGTVFHYEPRPDFAGEDGFSYTTEDGTTVVVVIIVEPMPDAPVLNRDVPATAEQGRLYSTVLEAADADGDVLRFSAVNLPAWLNLDARTGVLSGVPQQTDIGRVDGITLVVSDGTGLDDRIRNFQLEVIDVNDAPLLNITQVPREFFGSQSVSFDVFPTDLDNDSVTVSVDPHPVFDATVDGSRITVQVPDINEAQPAVLAIVGRDERGAVTREDVAVDLYPRTASGKGTTLLGFKEGRGIHIAILGDGYAEDEMRTFREHVEGVLDHIRSDEGIADHLGAFNIHMIEAVSQDSGADDSDLSDKLDTAFDSAYNCRSVPRLICADVLKLYEASLGEYPSVDQIILLVNDLRFGGSGNSGGRIAITSAFFPEIALHEMGHSLADLADEYVDPLILETSGLPPFEEGRYRNVSTSDDPAAVPWAHWIDPAAPLPQFANDEGVGIFQGGLYRSTGVFRGTFDSRMRSYSVPFGPVNTEQWILRLYTLTEGIRELRPRVQTLQIVAGEPRRFSVEPIFGLDVQQISWRLNGQPLTASGEVLPPAFDGLPTDPGLEITSILVGGVDGLSPVGSANETLTEIELLLPEGEHQLTLTVSDISNKIRVQPPHAGIFTWTWNLIAL